MENSHSSSSKESTLSQSKFLCGGTFSGQASHYRIVRLLGEGLTSTVYLVESVADKKEYALKWFKSDFLQKHQ